jgi:hypothetical protein
MTDTQPRVRLCIARPEGEIRLTWVTPRSLGLVNGASREVLMLRATEKGVDFRCPAGIAERVADILRSGQVTASWAMARVCELPDGNTMLIRQGAGGILVTKDTVGGTFCPANEWWFAVVL